MAELDAFLRSGKRPEEYFHVRRPPMQAPPPKPFSPEQVKDLRDALGVSQSTFASALAVSIKTLQAWEQGVGAPPPMACRLLELIAADKPHWRARLRGTPGPTSRKRAG